MTRCSCGAPHPAAAGGVFNGSTSEPDYLDHGVARLDFWTCRACSSTRALEVRPLPGVGARVDGAAYLTARGYVAAEDLTVEEVAQLAPVFRLRDAHLLCADAFAVLCGALGLDVVRIAGVVVGRLRGRRAA